MKKTKRIIVFAILAAMLLSLCGCGLFRTRVAKAAVKMSKLESLHADVEMQLGVDLSLLGQDINADVSVTGGADIQRDPAQVYMDLTAEVATIEQGLLLYGTERDGGFDVYYSADSGENWIKGSIDADGDAKDTKVDGKSVFLLLSDSAASFKEYGKEKVNGADAIRYNGEITSAELKTALKLANAKQALEEGLGVELDDDVFSNIGSIPVSIWVDVKTDMIVRIEMDLSDVVQGVVPIIVDKAIENAGVGIDVDTMVHDVILSITLSEFDTAQVTKPAALNIG